MRTHFSKIFQLVLIITLSTGISGCWDLREINQSAVPIALGIDKDKQKIKVSALLVEPKPSGAAGGGEMQTVLVSSSDYSVSMAARRIMLTLSRTPDWTHIQNMILGQSLCENELPLIMDFMSRNRNLVPGVNLLVAEQSQPDMIIENVSSTGSGLRQLLLNNEFQLGMYVPVTKGDFNYAMMTPGIEAAIPEVRLEEVTAPKANPASGNKNSKKEDTKTKRIVLSGTAVFKGNKMIGSLNADESKGYRWLKSSTKTGGFLVIQSPVHNHMDVDLEVIRFSSKMTPRLKNNQLSMEIEIDAELAFYEDACTGDILTPQMQNRLKKKINQEIDRQIRSCINKTQALNSDILGWGLLLQEHLPDTWSTLGPEWDTTYPAIDYEIKIKTNIVHTYLSKKSFEIR